MIAKRPTFNIAINAFCTGRLAATTLDPAVSFPVWLNSSPLAWSDDVDQAGKLPCQGQPTGRCSAELECCEHIWAVCYYVQCAIHLYDQMAKES